MIEASRRAYLEAMGFEVWTPRPAAACDGRLSLGPGSGSLLFVAASAEDTANRLAGDIARLLGEEPVWAWPDPAARPESPTLGGAIEERNFRRVLIFGESLARALTRGSDGDGPPGAVLRTCSLEKLATSAVAKRGLWEQFAAWLGTDAAGRSP